MCSIVLIAIVALVTGYCIREIKDYFNQEPPAIEDDFDEEDDEY